MRIHLLAVGRRMPAWVEKGFADYADRLPRECQLELHEINPGQRNRNSSPARAIADESKRMLAALPKAAYVIALDEHGQVWSSTELSARLKDWQMGGRDVALLVGGPDGLSAECLARAESRWSLSRLTLPHALVRIVVAEQIYRAHSILKNHPYHRE